MQPRGAPPYTVLEPALHFSFVNYRELFFFLARWTVATTRYSIVFKRDPTALNGTKARPSCAAELIRKTARKQRKTWVADLTDRTNFRYGKLVKTDSRS